uniref:Ig-like domain-containing protein n=1 Tax=Xiphophorus maculatus TaxID=8083 RepID=A0A3B5Q8T5_XIPMA
MKGLSPVWDLMWTFRLLLLEKLFPHVLQENGRSPVRTGQSVSFSCGGTDQCGSNYVYWYQKKETETFRAILYISSGGSPTKPYNHPQQDDFSAERDRSSSSLKINKVKLDHSASYYCGCWKSGSHRFSYLFGSGTKLFVTGKNQHLLVLLVYPAASSARRGRRGFLLCLASGMFPPEVKFTWKRLEDDGEKDLTSGEQLELREPNRTASILLVDRDLLSTSRYRCSVQHEGGPVEAPTTQGDEAGRPGGGSGGAEDRG